MSTKRTRSYAIDTYDGDDSGDIVPKKRHKPRGKTSGASTVEDLEPIPAVRNDRLSMVVHVDGKEVPVHTLAYFKVQYSVRVSRVYQILSRELLPVLTLLNLVAGYIDHPIILMCRDLRGFMFRCLDAMDIWEKEETFEAIFRDVLPDHQFNEYRFASHRPSLIMEEEFRVILFTQPVITESMVALFVPIDYAPALLTLAEQEAVDRICDDLDDHGPYNRAARKVVPWEVQLVLDAIFHKRNDLLDILTLRNRRQSDRPSPVILWGQVMYDNDFYTSEELDAINAVALMKSVGANRRIDSFVEPTRLRD